MLLLNLLDFMKKGLECGELVLKLKSKITISYIGKSTDVLRILGKSSFTHWIIDPHEIDTGYGINVKPCFVELLLGG